VKEDDVVSNEPEPHTERQESIGQEADQGQSRPYGPYVLLATLVVVVVVSILILFFYMPTFENFFREYWPSEFFQEYWPVMVLGILSLILLALLGYTLGASALGFGPHDVKETKAVKFDGVGEQAKPTEQTITTEKQRYRTLWDWMTVLTISAVIGAVALTFTWSQAKQQRYVQDQQARDAALLAYLDTMSGLIFDRHLLANPDEEDLTPEELAAARKELAATRDVARARTLVALLAIGPERRRNVVRFLYEADLIRFDPDNPENRVVDLTQANLTDANLSRMPLSGIDLKDANLSDGLDEPNGRGANLKKSDLRGARLVEAKLQSANLEDANLQGARLVSANLTDARLGDGLDGNDRGANLEGANLEGTNLEGASVTQKQLDQAESLQGAIMPNGRKYEDWLKDEEDREGGGETTSPM
jgi:uncharacterized protein YjbI with pentapeptide repeats